MEAPTNRYVTSRQPPLINYLLVRLRPRYSSFASRINRRFVSRSQMPAARFFDSSIRHLAPYYPLNSFYQSLASWPHKMKRKMANVYATRRSYQNHAIFVADKSGPALALIERHSIKVSRCVQIILSIRSLVPFSISSRSEFVRPRSLRPV